MISTLHISHYSRSFRGVIISNVSTNIEENVESKLTKVSVSKLTIFDI